MNRGKQTYKYWFRLVNGYDYDHKCGECEWCHRFVRGSKSWFKCMKLGMTHSTATDIRLKDPACKQFSERSEDG